MRRKRRLVVASVERGNGVGRLTPMEQSVAELVADGRRNAEIAAALGVSPKTVEWHLTRVYRKLGVRSRTELALSMPGKPRGPGPLPK